MPQPNPAPEHVPSTGEQPSITIIGAGFGGLGTAIALRRAGYTDVTVLEKAERVGGVWRDNTYPDAACDVPSSLYSWSFAPNPGWPHRYSRQDEILAYIERTARQEGVLDLVRSGVEVTAAAYDEQTCSWELETASGETIRTDVLVSAVGQLSRPVVPHLPGIDTFEGPAFHSAQWDHSVDLRGKRVAVLGTGASAIQFVPAIQPEVGHLTVFQRSAPYVVPKPDREYTATHARLFRRFPPAQAFGRNLTKVLSEQLNRSLTGHNPTKLMMKLAWRAQLRAQVKDPALRAKLVPDYPLGCKRLLFSNDWYPALVQPNVELVTDPAVEVLPHGVRSADGEVHEVDVIIYGTGFAATEFLAPMQLRGVDGADLQERWKSGARAYLGLSRARLPQPVRGLRAQHQPRRQLDHQHAGGAGGRDHDPAGPHPAGRSAGGRGQRGGRAEIRRRGPGAARRQRLGGLRQLVPRPRRPGDHQLAGDGRGVPAALRRPRPRRLRHRGDPAGPRRGQHLSRTPTVRRRARRDGRRRGR